MTRFKFSMLLGGLIACGLAACAFTAASASVPDPAMFAAAALAASAVPPSTSLQSTEDYSAAKATAPRVSLDDMKAKIVAAHFFTAGEAVAALGQPTNPNSPLNLLTVAVLVMENGFTVIGKSAPASPENFDPEKGRTFAYEDAIRQLWPLEGYALRDRLSQAA